MGVDDLRNSRDNATSVYTEFTRLYKENELALYCFLRGKKTLNTMELGSKILLNQNIHTGVVVVKVKF